MSALRRLLLHLFNMLHPGRAVVRYPVAALVAVVSLAFGIGAMTTTLTVRDVVVQANPIIGGRAQLSVIVP